MKRKIALLLAMVLVLASFTIGCSNGQSQDKPSSGDENQVSEQKETKSFEELQAKGPVLITSFGQSADGAMIKAVLGKIEVEYEYNSLVSEDELDGVGTLIIAAGASSKGLGAAGIKPEEEIERAKKLVEALKDKDITVIVAHIGGENRRGELSDQCIKVALEASDAIILVEGGDSDGLFKTYSSENAVPMEVSPSIAETTSPFQAILK